MSTFTAKCGYANCGNPNCNGFLAYSSLDEDGNCLETNWDDLIVKYNAHTSQCTPENPYLDDPNWYYGGNPEDCYQEPCEY